VNSHRSVVGFVVIWLAGASAALSQAQGSVRHIGILSSRARPASLQADWRFGPFLSRLTELGYLEGKNLSIEWRFAENDYTKLPVLAADLVQRKVEVIVAVGSEGIVAAQAATKTIPIVFSGGIDLVAQGLVRSLAHPGGHTTGISPLYADIYGKEIELLLATVPGISRLGVLFNPDNPSISLALQRIRDAGATAGVELIFVEARSVSAIEPAIVRASREGAQALLWATDSMYLDHRRQIAEVCNSHRLPSIGSLPLYADDGGLLGYGATNAEIWRRVAEIVVKILQGTDAGEIPVEQPTKLELHINRKTAKALGLKIPPELLVQADKVIE
jgi:putative tryptophan/tyrosine transport system substrate-binding protein